MLLAGATPGLVRPAGCSQLPRRCSLVSHVPQRVATRCSKFRVNAYQTSASDFVNASAVEDYRTMQVQPGDGALKIARIHSISMAELVALNPSTDMSALEVGPPPASGLTSANASRMLVPQPPSEDLALDLQSSVAGAVAHFKVYLTKASRKIPVTTIATTAPAAAPVGITRCFCGNPLLWVGAAAIMGLLVWMVGKLLPGWRQLGGRASRVQHQAVRTPLQWRQRHFMRCHQNLPSASPVVGASRLIG
mmetsp:Transcript_33534/g.73175  ORF Transcript_33534/g.73175 Transcript_33534/m.73175 type:complete len:249 (+) Transcript_33534:238-984(+)